MPNRGIGEAKMYRKPVTRATPAGGRVIVGASAEGGRSEVGTRGGRAAGYEEWTMEDLHERASELDIDGWSSLSEDELVTALRNH
jgi:hypothetical protein